MAESEEATVLLANQHLRIEYVAVEKLRGWPRNPRKISPEQRRALAENLRRYGFVDPIVVNSKLMILGGHQRVDVAKELGFKKIPVVRVNITNAKDVATINLALNKISGEWDYEKLLPVLEELEGLPELDFTGFSAEEITEVADTVDIAALEDASGGMVANNKVNLTIVPYLGGKHRLVNRLLPLIPPHKIYCEVFGGAASLLLNKPPSEREVYNDVDSEIVNLLMQIRDNLQALQDHARTIPYSRELFERWRQDILQNRVDQLDPVERAARYYYIMRSAYAGAFFKGWGYHREGGEGDKDPKGFQTFIDGLPAISQRLRGAYIDHLDFAKCIEHWDSAESFLYLDPPYYEIGSHDYRHQMTEAQHEALAEQLKGVKARWLLNYAYHPKIREFYRTYPTRLIKTNASVKKAELGETRGLSIKNLVITNYDPAQLKERPFATVLEES